jgi:choline kinase
MKAIIVGAGRGRRLMPHTRALPKCMLRLGDRRVLDWILGALAGAGIDNIVFVEGYRGDVVRKAYPGLRFVRNSAWRHNNILESLMCASADFDQAVVVSYSDIFYQEDLVKRIVASESDVTIAIDPDWRIRYEGRSLHPESEAEKVLVDRGLVRDIGKHLDPSTVQGEFIGLAHFSDQGANELRDCYSAILSTRQGAPFHNAPSLRQAYFTDMIKELICCGTTVTAIPVDGMWDELDTPEDEHRVQVMVSELLEGRDSGA